MPLDLLLFYCPLYTPFEIHFEKNLFSGGNSSDIFIRNFKKILTLCMLGIFLQDLLSSADFFQNTDFQIIT